MPLSIVDFIRLDINGHESKGVTNPITYAVNVFNRPYSKMGWQYASSHETEKNYKIAEDQIPLGMVRFPVEY
jgi:hypothetical protein